MLSEEIIDKIIEKSRQFDARKVIVFGSVLEDIYKCNDIDIACDMPGLNMFLFADELEKILNKPIDVIPISDKDPFMAIVNKNGRVVYEI